MMLKVSISRRLVVINNVNKIFNEKSWSILLDGSLNVGKTRDKKE